MAIVENRVLMAANTKPPINERNPKRGSCFSKIAMDLKICV
ncbi:hypothetical protein SDC9_198374 [bioreactor metagenome]|uniref:Uncharacterized protein n=1 Tax=bioreactor metagenome TaxID=1076179 RepID=A0A645IHH5_9ZZZZ